MVTKLEAIQELARRGALPPDLKPYYDEAVSRGLIEGTSPAAGPTPAEFAGRFTPPPEPADVQMRQDALRAHMQPAIDEQNGVGGPWDNILRSLQLGVQDVGRGAANLAGAPFDLTNMAINAGVSGVSAGSQMAGGPAIDARLPTNAGQVFQNLGTEAATAAGAPPIPWGERSPGERLTGRAAELGTEFMGGGAGLAARAPAAAAHAADIFNSSSTPFSRLLDVASNLYRNNPGRAFAMDAAAGTGAGASMEAVDQNIPDGPWKPWIEMAAGLAGSAAGSSLMRTGQGTAEAALRSVDRFAPDPGPTGTGIWNPETGKRFTKRQVSDVADVFQGAASDPAKARDAVTAAANDLFGLGAGKGETPTTGMLSGDIGLNAMENRFRVADGVPFMERDQAVARGASDRVAGIRDPNANPTDVQQGAKDLVQSMKDTRDAEAFPLLAQAEQAGVTVDAAPVAALIDQKLATAKRPPVRAALTEARKLLNAVGGDQLDTSVSGLYETRKAINDVIEGRGENATGRYAARELIDVRNRIDEALAAASPEFGQYLAKYREGSTPLDQFAKGAPAEALLQEGDARNAAKKILSKEWGSDQEIAAVQDAIKGDETLRGNFKAAVADVLSRRVTKARQAGDNFEVSLAKLSTEFRKHEDTLAKVFDKSEMDDLRAGHKMLSYFANAGRRATAGSDTAEKLTQGMTVFGAGYKKVSEIVLKIRYGVLRGGGQQRILNLIAEQLPRKKNALADLAHMAWFNPDLMAYLLGKPVRNIEAIPMSKGLRTAILAHESLLNPPEGKQPQ